VFKIKNENIVVDFKKGCRIIRNVYMYDVIQEKYNADNRDIIIKILYNMDTKIDLSSLLTIINNLKFIPIEIKLSIMDDMLNEIFSR